MNPKHLGKRQPCLNFWRIDSEYEVDFIINEEVAIEVKSTEFVQDKHLKGLNKFAELGPVKRMILVSRDLVKRKIGDIEVIPYTIFLEELWDGKIF